MQGRAEELLVTPQARVSVHSSQTFDLSVEMQREKGKERQVGGFITAPEYTI